ncbi:transposable element Tc1 transposase [Trichonephila clavipes]|uniref:Transposable element Tc1 transposase n=1 Tax=Trichonephila clavipes TaxID=2585209 RepID=A0A8X7BAK3_TRICX|nr:transposable element Tc1 transposase [Trichonephila clavipes]
MRNVTYWQKVVFSDESRFVLGTDDNRVRVWRRPGPFLNGLPGAIFQQDNARPPTARVAQDFLRHFQTIPWPARSPDLSLLAHAWDQLKWQMPSCHSVHDLELVVQDFVKTAGWSTRRVAGQVDRSECAVRNCWEQWTREGTHARKTGSGATRKTTRREDRRIVRQALVDPTMTRSTIRADVSVAIVPQTISRHLAEVNFKSKRPFRAIALTPEHRQLRLQWCQVKSMWNDTGWQKVVFSDESWFVLETDDNRVWVWRHPGERYNSSHTVLRHTARTAGVMV